MDKLQDKYSSITEDFKAAVKACIKFELQVDQNKGNITEEKAKNFILREIVRPLHKDYKKWPVHENSRREIKLDHTIYQQTPANGTLVTQLYDGDTKIPDARTKQFAKKYLGDVKRFGNMFIRHSKEESPRDLPEWQQRPVRVAIIDSGVDESDQMISGAINKKRIIEQKDWTGSGRDDTHGHGTHVARLLLDLAPNAELYIAKISESKCLSDTNYPTLGKAIEYAIDEWDVDIISLSLGMDEFDASIDAALDKALIPKDTARERIVFAAASNGGAGRPRAFPARKRGVICINASDGHGGDIQRLSPGCDSETENFVTLGIDIPSRWKGAETFISGTSFATPIATAIAADILELARLYIDMGDAQKRWLYSSRGIRAAFKEFSCPVQGYRFLTPWGFSPEEVKPKMQTLLVTRFLQ
ncbi:MAG: hypothetical protein M1821_005882 [Bathelium mastoideum]|nr:MAG: hypothetical protein M1821_005882 [Bathelium mastoideum]